MHEGDWEIINFTVFYFQLFLVIVTYNLLQVVNRLVQVLNNERLTIHKIDK